MRSSFFFSSRRRHTRWPRDWSSDVSLPILMAPQTRYARNGDVSIAYETFGDTAQGEPLLLIMGLDFQMVWWPDAFCERLVACGFSVVRFDNRDTGLSTHFSSRARQ